MSQFIRVCYGSEYEFRGALRPDGLFPHMSHVAWSVCLGELCRNGCMNQSRCRLGDRLDDMWAKGTLLSPRKLSRGIMESPAYVCLSVCLSVANITK